MKKAGLLVFVCLLAAVPLFADSVAAHWLKSSAVARTYPPPPLRAAAHGAAANVVASLDVASDNAIDSLRHWNTSGRVPMKIGLERELLQALNVGGDVSALSNEPWRWRGSVYVAATSRLRLKLTNVHAGADTIFWVYNADGDSVGFDASLAQNGTLWTPSVAGETITLEVQSPASAPASFTISAVADMRRPSEVSTTSEACIKDMQCYDGLEQLETTVAHMEFVSDQSVYICSGGLIADMQLTGTPYFMTAHHCISTAAEASSVETYWDYKTHSCNGLDPGLGGLPRVIGSTIMATTETQDMTLLRLSALPGGTRYFLGWTSTRPAVGDTLYRISHPDGQPQRFSTEMVENTSSECIDTSRTNFLYSKPILGTVIGGSSGSPVFNTDGQLVGTLTGACPGSADPCGPAVRTIDGAFSTAYAANFRQYLNPDTNTSCSVCTPNSQTACLLGNRFKVTMTWHDFSANLQGNGSVITYSENQPQIDPVYGPLSESTFFSMYSFAPKSIEAIVRMIKGQSINNKYWVFLTGFAGAEYTVTVQDTQTCTTWQRTVQSGATNVTKDFEAFPFP